MVKRNLIFSRNRAFLLAAAVCVFALAAAAPARALDVLKGWEKSIGHDISYYHYKASHSGQPVQIHVVRIPLSRDDISIRPVLAWDQLNRLETVGSMASRYDAIVAINGSYFNRKQSAPFPVGFLMINGRTLYFSHGYRSAFGLTFDRLPIFGYPKTQGIVYLQDKQKYFFFSGMNRKRGVDEALIYTPEYGERTGTNEHGKEIVVENEKVIEMRDGNSRIPRSRTSFVISLHGEAREKYFSHFQIGDKVALRFQVDKDWLYVNESLTGGPMLVEGGRIVVDGAERESFSRGNNSRIPITAVGSDGGNNLYLMVADGRQKGYSVGMTYLEAAFFMRDYLGCWDAIGLDGGGSSTMVINGEVVNRPSDGAPRQVSNGIVITKNP